MKIGGFHPLNSSAQVLRVLMSDNFSQTRHFVSTAESELSQAFDSDFNTIKQSILTDHPTVQGSSFRITYIRDPRGNEFKQIQVLLPSKSENFGSKSSISLGKIATLAILAFLLILPFVLPQQTQAQTAPAIGSGLTEYRK